MHSAGDDDKLQFFLFSITLVDAGASGARGMPFDGSEMNWTATTTGNFNLPDLLRCRVNAQLREAHPGGG
jgi:hypothetical protein